MQAILSTQQKMDYWLKINGNRQLDQQAKANSFITHPHTQTQDVKLEQCLNLHFPEANFTNILQKNKWQH